MHCEHPLLGVRQLAAGEEERLHVALVVLGLLQRQGARVAGELLGQVLAELHVVAEEAGRVLGVQRRGWRLDQAVEPDLLHLAGQRVEAPQVGLVVVHLALEPGDAALRVVLLEVRRRQDAIRPLADVGRVECVDVDARGGDAELALEGGHEVGGGCGGAAAARDEVLVALAGDVGGVVHAVAQRADRDDVAQSAAVAHADVAPDLLGHAHQVLVQRAGGRRRDLPARDDELLVLAVALEQGQGRVVLGLGRFPQAGLVGAHQVLEIAGRAGRRRSGRQGRDEEGQDDEGDAETGEPWKPTALSHFGFPPGRVGRHPGPGPLARRCGVNG